MIDFSNCRVIKVIAHGIGNKLRDEGIDYSSAELNFEGEETVHFFTQYILSSFKGDEFFRFAHDTNVALNEAYSYVSTIFDNTEEFIKESKNIATHLYSETIHPRIGYGELYLVYITDCIVEGEMMDAIGIFKSETKDVFLRPFKDGAGFSLTSERGINIGKLDKGCLVFNTEGHLGLKISITSNGKGEEVQYWKDRFLKITPRDDSYHSTKDYMSFAKDFVTKQLTKEFEISSADKADYLNRSVEYFKSNDVFTERAFAREVFEDPAVIKSFKRFKEEFQDRNSVELKAEFEIIPQIVKKQEKVFQSVLKLDKNFHIYIHGNTELIERGYDAKSGKQFYKIYFDKEA